MQVDRRYHHPAGAPDAPFSIEHIIQATHILFSMLGEVSAKHPKWTDSNRVKGACVAYNSGVKNVQSVPGMNLGTTGNDYGDDVIARSQFYYDAGLR